MDEIIKLYTLWSGHAPQRFEALPKAGSNRHYARLYDAEGNSVIGVNGPSVDENNCFVYLARHFASKGLPVPQIFAVSKDSRCYLQQDLGRTALYDALKPSRENGFQYTEADKQLLAQTLRQLAHVQVEGTQGLDYGQCLSPVKFNVQAAMFDLHYFKYSFLKTTDVEFDELRLEDDLLRMAADLVGDEGEQHFFLYRDFQARNVMLVDGKPCFIDFQGGMEGPLQYDVASFLWQASARYPQQLRDELIGVYVAELTSLLGTFDEKRFRERLHLFVVFRTLQVLGAYGLRGYFERKAYFLKSIPLAIQNLRQLLDDSISRDYPYLYDVLQRMIALPQFAPALTGEMKMSQSKYDGQGPLTVRVFSFSYKKGIPEDTSGNGGGYVFDCRSTHNPGRYEQYKPLTGLDAPVIKFLEDDGEILTFLQSVYALADAHVERYMKRGFTDLMFSFGCTGGRHRSVYSAQHLAEHLHAKYGIEVRVCHREQGISTVLKRS